MIENVTNHVRVKSQDFTPVRVSAPSTESPEVSTFAEPQDSPGRVHQQLKRSLIRALPSWGAEVRGKQTWYLQRTAEKAIDKLDNDVTERRGRVSYLAAAGGAGAVASLSMVAVAIFGSLGPLGWAVFMVGSMLAAAGIVGAVRSSKTADELDRHKEELMVALAASKQASQAESMLKEIQDGALEPSRSLR